MIHVSPPAGGAQRAQCCRTLAVLTGTDDDADGEGAGLRIVDPGGHLLDCSSPEARDWVAKLDAAVWPSGASLGEECSQLHE